MDILNTTLIIFFKYNNQIKIKTMTETIGAKIVHKEFNSASEKFQTNNSTPDELRSVGFYRQAEMLDVMKAFPLNKIISKTDVIKICEKYGLLLGSLDRFCGHVPDKNMTEVMAFRKSNPPKISYEISYCCFDTMEQAIKKQKELKGFFSKEKPIRERYRDGEYFICAPQNDFIIDERDRVVNREILTEDPIVLFRPIYSPTSFVIVTAWGDEASDELVVNEINN